MDHDEAIGELVDGDVADCVGRKCNDKGEVLDETGKVVGHVKTLSPAQEAGSSQKTAEDEGGGAGGEAGAVREGVGKEAGEGVGKEAGEGVGKEAGEGVGKKIGEGAGRENLGGGPREEHREGPSDGGNLEKKGSVAGHAEGSGEDVPRPELERDHLSILDGRTVNKQGNVIGPDDVPVGRLVQGNAKLLAGKKVDGKGQIWSDSGGKVIGRVELIPEDERDEKEGPFWGFTGLSVFKDGKVKDVHGNVVGIVTSGDTKRLAGRAVDEDGDIIDKFGNVKGHAEPYDEPEEAVSGKAQDELADKMSAICERTLEEVQPVLKQITEVCLSLRFRRGPS